MQRLPALVFQKMIGAVFPDLCITKLTASPRRLLARSGPQISSVDSENGLLHRRALRGRSRPMFHPVIGCFTALVGSRQEIVFSPVRRRAMRSVMAMWITASERLGRVSQSRARRRWSMSQP